MIAQPHPALQAAERCCEVLERAGDALVGLDLPALLATEAALAEVVVLRPPVGGGADADALTELVGRARAALLRCKRLGISFDAMASVRTECWFRCA